ncbi:MAG: sialidase family protein [Planctomycetota bacterium]
MRCSHLALATFGLASSALAQDPRAPLFIDPNAGAFTPSIASDGDLTAVFVPDSGDLRVYVADGRALSFSAQVSVVTGSPSFVGIRSDIERSPLVSGNSIYAIWQDNRNDNGSAPSENDLFLARSIDGGSSFSTEIAIPKGSPEGTGALRNFETRVAPGDPDLIYVLQTVDPGNADEQLWLAVSEDGGLSFLEAVLVTQGSRGDVDEIGFDVDGDNVYVAWVDDRSGGTDDLFFQKSTDRGQSWASIDRIIDGTGYGVGDVSDNVEVEVAGDKVVVAWGEEDSGDGNEILHVTVSNDAGETFGPVLTIGGYTPVVDDVDGVDLEVAPDGRIYVTWEDNRGGGDEIYLWASGDDGVTSTETRLSLNTGAAFPQVVVADDANNLGHVFVQWIEDVGSDDEVFAALSDDGGLTFEAPVRLSPVGTDADFAFASYNPLYNNFVVVNEQEGGSGDEALVTGFRGQTLTVSGFAAGPSTLTFELEGFPTTDTLGVVVGALSLGTLPLPEAAQRDLGLSIDALTNVTLSAPPIALSGGAGISGGVPINLPSGLSFNFAALSISVDPSNLIGELTDVVTVTN